MSEHDAVPSAVERKPGPRSLQLIWIVPILAAIVGGFIALKSVWEHGPTITITFLSGEGIEAGKTKIKHKAVDIGTVKSVGLSSDHKKVIVRAEIDRSAASDGFLAEDTRFWVVRPRIAGGQVQGLGTLLAGSYIGSDPGQSKNEKKEFVGLETPPPITSDLPGRKYQLRADDVGSLDIGSPVYFRGIVAGRVVSTEIANDGKSADVGVFVHSPYDKFVTTDTRFWNASGVDLSVDASGLKLATESLATLLLGGIAFEAPPESAAPAAEQNTQFPLWNTRADALRERESVVETYRMVFTQSVRGLAVGAPVDFRGVTVGEVSGIELEFDPDTVNFVTAVTVHLWPERLRAHNRDPKKQWNSSLTPVQRLQRFVAHGFRGQLRAANLITGQLYVAVDFFPKAPPTTLDTKRTPPEIPTMQSSMAQLEESLGNIVKNLEKVPFDKLAADLRRALDTLDKTLKRADTVMTQLSNDVAPELRATLEQARKTLGSAQQVLSSDSPVQGDLRETLQEVTRAAEQVRALTDYLERHPESLIRGRRPSGDSK